MFSRRLYPETEPSNEGRSDAGGTREREREENFGEHICVARSKSGLPSLQWNETRKNKKTHSRPWGVGGKSPCDVSPGERLLRQELRTNFGRQRKNSFGKKEESDEKKGLPKVRRSSGTKKEPRINFKVFFFPRRAKPTDLLSKNASARRFAICWLGPEPDRSLGKGRLSESRERRELTVGRIGRLVLRVRLPARRHLLGHTETPGAKAAPPVQAGPPGCPGARSRVRLCLLSSAKPALDGRGAGTMRRVSCLARLAPGDDDAAALTLGSHGWGRFAFPPRLFSFSLTPPPTPHPAWSLFPCTLPFLSPPW